MQITGRVIGGAEVRQKIAKFREEVPDLIDRAGISKTLINQIKARFRAQTKPDGGQWAPLSQNTKKGPAPLVQTKALYEAIGELRGSASGRFGISTGFGFRIGINNNPYTVDDQFKDPAEYGRVLQLGRSHPAPMPARPFIGINSADVTLITRNMRRKLKRAEARFNT